MITLKDCTTDSADYQWAECVMKYAFPEAERRDEAKQRWLINHQACFHFQLVYASNRCVGLLTWWNLGDFVYIEHFAIEADSRGRGYGALALQAFLGSTSMPVVLEVEPPTEPIAERRIAFYERLGFVLHADYFYMQPPYRTTSPAVRLLLMSRESGEALPALPTVQETLYRVVYQCIVASK